MTNLLPAQGKKRLKQQYWMRVATVFFIVAGIGFLVSAATLLPTYFYISFQSNALKNASAAHQADTLSFREMDDAIELANDISVALTADQEYINVNEVQKEIIAFSEGLATINNISIAKEEYVTSVVVSGVAFDRESLVEFRDKAEAHRFFTYVKLPLSNLAKDQDIPFSLTLEPSETLMNPL